MRKALISGIEIKKLAHLAKIPLNEEEINKMPGELTEVLQYMSKISSLDTENTEETSQTTKLENIFREDSIDAGRILTQKQALSNAKETHNGYFKVEAIFEE